MQGVYQIRNTANGKKYIGSSEDIKKRWRKHQSCLRGNRHDNPHLQNAWNRYGKDAFIFETLEKIENSLEREQWYLDNVVEWGRDYNIARDVFASMRGRTHSEESKKRMSEAQKGKTLSEEVRMKISEANSGENHPMYGKHQSEEWKRKKSGENHPMWGKHHTEETKKKLSKVLTGRTYSKETKRKMSEGQTGRKHTEETKRKISKANIGENNPNWGKRPSEETRMKISEANSGENNSFWGKCHTEETKQKISEALTGKHHSEETKRKLSKAHRGEKNHSSKLTEGQVRELHAKYATGNYTYKELADPLPVSRGTVGKILRGKSWKDVYEKFHNERLDEGRRL